MPFPNEAAFERDMRELIRSGVLPALPYVRMMESKKAVDILLYRETSPALFFLEIKYHQHHHGRCGIGQGKGGGFQPEILRVQPTYFETNMRWILGVEDQDGYLFLPNSTVRKYLSGSGIGEKYNNISSRIFREEHLLSEVDLCNSLQSWLAI